MTSGIAAILLLSAAAAIAAPPIDENAMKAALAKGEVKVVSLERHLGPPKVPDGPFARACESWNLTGDQVLTFFAHATAILPEDLHATYNVVPCQYSGSLSIKGTVYEFSINAGAFGVIRGTPPERVALFGCKAECNGLFRIRSEAE
ncbi:MAG TPA: hypothetical protein VJ299_08525 [Steroidobacteraceae bacterium]|jgi:hypothetical protein|nr:hypothetical protein [Steroidobacteraceae bacterium]HJY37495.1 hypothetical protein [Steroidobacteraceae bacterium]